MGHHLTFALVLNLDLSHGCIPQRLLPTSWSFSPSVTKWKNIAGGRFIVFTSTRLLYLCVITHGIYSFQTAQSHVFRQLFNAAGAVFP